jgi:hypothetical protein
VTGSSGILARQFRLLLIGLGVAAGVVLFQGSALAFEVAGAELTVTRAVGAEGCPDERELARTTLALGAREADAPATPLTVSVEFTRPDSGFRVSIRVEGAKEGLRELWKSDDTCAPLGEAASVVLAVLLDLVPPAPRAPEVADPSPEATEFQVPVIDEPRSSVLVDRVEEQPHSRSGASDRASHGVAVEAYAGLGFGIFDQGTSGFFGGAVRPHFANFEPYAGVLWVPSRSVPEATRHVELTLLGPRFGACYWLTRPPRTVGFAGCAGALIGFLTVRGHGFNIDKRSSELWLAGEAGLAARLALAGPVELRFALSATFSPRRTFSAEGVGVVHEIGPISALAELGPEFHFQ